MALCHVRTGVAVLATDPAQRRKGRSVTEEVKKKFALLQEQLGVLVPACVVGLDNGREVESRPALEGVLATVGEGHRLNWRLKQNGIAEEPFVVDEAVTLLQRAEGLRLLPDAKTLGEEVKRISHACLQQALSNPPENVPMPPQESCERLEFVLFEGVEEAGQALDYLLPVEEALSKIWARHVVFGDPVPPIGLAVADLAHRIFAHTEGSTLAKTRLSSFLRGQDASYYAAQDPLAGPFWKQFFLLHGRG